MGKVNLIKASLSLSGVMIISKIFSFFRDIMLAQELGTTIYADAFLTSQSILMVFVSFLISPFAASYLPIATDYYTHESLEDQKCFFGAVYTLASIIGLVVMIAEIILLNNIIKIVVPGFDENGVAILRSIMVIQIPIILCTFIITVNSGNLRILDKFNIAELTNIIVPLFIVLYLFVFSRDVNVIGLSISVVIGNIVVVLIQAICIVKNGIKPKFNFQFNNNHLKKIILTMGTLMIDGVSREINGLVDRAMASTLPTGSITTLSYANKMTFTEVGLISVAISLVVFSQLAKCNSNNDKDGMREIMKKAINFVNTIIIPIAAITILLRFDIIRVLFGRGNFGENSIIITANNMMCYAIGMFGFGMQDVLMRGMHAAKHTKFPATMSLVMVIINIVLNLLLYKKMGTYGLALATSISVLVIIPPLAWYLNKYIINLRELGIIKNLIKTIICTVAMSFSIWISNVMFSKVISNSFIILLICGTIGVCVYAVLLVVTKNPIIDEFRNMDRI